MAKSVISMNVKADGTTTASNKIKKVGDACSNAGNKAISLSKLVSGIAIGNAITAGLQKTAGIVKSLTAGSMDLYAVQEQAEAKLGAVLNATGNAAGFSQKELEGYASELQGITTIGDEVYLSSMSVLAGFREIKGDNFKKATLAAADLSTVMGIDLTNAAKQIGKALADPVAGISELKRVGIVAGDAVKARLQELISEGKKEEAQLLILNELQKRFGGAAEAAAQTATGKIQQLKNAWGDLKEGIGAVIAETLNIDLGTNFTEQIGKAASFLRENAARIGTTIKGLVIDIMVFGKNTVDVFLTIGEICLTSFQNVYEAGRWAWDAICAIWRDTPGFFSAMWEDIKDTADNIWNLISVTVSSSFEMWGKIGTSFLHNWKSIFNDLWEITKRTFLSIGTYILESIKGIARMAASLGKNFWDLITGKKKFSEAVGGVFNDYIKEVANLKDKVAENWEGFELGKGTKQFIKDTDEATVARNEKVANAALRVLANGTQNMERFFEKSGVKAANFKNPLKGTWDKLQKSFEENQAWGDSLKKKNSVSKQKIAAPVQLDSASSSASYNPKAASLAIQGTQDAYKIIAAARNGNLSTQNKMLKTQQDTAENTKEMNENIKKLVNFNSTPTLENAFSLNLFPI